MAEPEHTSMHNFAYHPSVASWVQSTALAQLDAASDEAATQAAPDDFYKPASSSTAASIPDYHPLPQSSSSSPADDNMTSTRQRQQTPSGAARSTPRLSVRSVSGSVTSTTSTPRSTPQIPANRPTVRSLAQKFNQPSSADSSPSSSRARPVRQPTAKDVPSYGSYKFNNLKARERSQPAPVRPSSTSSPSNARRTANGTRSSLGQQPTSTPSPSRKKITSPVREPGKQLFGEVIGDHDSLTPGFGIPNIEDARRDTASAESSTIKLVTEDVPSALEVCQAETLAPHHQQSASGTASQQLPENEPMMPHPQAPDSGTPRKNAPPSRIPVATRRMSASSASTSSSRSSKFNGARPVGHNRTSPSRIAKVPVGRSGIASRATSKAAPLAQHTLPAASYRGYRERGKSPQAGPSVSAVITAPPPPTSPRLRNSRERQLLQEPPGPAPSTPSRSADPYAPQDYFTNGDAPATHSSQMTMGAAPLGGKPSVKLVDASSQESDDAPVDDSPQSAPLDDGLGQDVAPVADTAPQVPLNLSTDGLQIPSPRQSLSAATSFEYDDSPILGMPGSFLTTPPLAQYTPPADSHQFEPPKEQAPVVAPSQSDQLLQPRAFQPPSTSVQTPEIPDTETNAPEAPSEVGLRESIPIMLGMDGTDDAWNPVTGPSKPSPRLNMAEPKWSSNSIQHVVDEDSPIDPFSRRETLKPEDSASNIGFAEHNNNQQQREQQQQQQSQWRSYSHDTNAIRRIEERSLVLNPTAYSVINRVLNMYHASDVITPAIANDARLQVQKVSVFIAQHNDWGSKEATETYLTRVLSDATSQGVEKDMARPRRLYDRPTSRPASRPVSRPISKNIPMSIRALEADPDEADVGGTAIIFPTESQRYSRGSRTSNASTTTTIWEGPSRPDSSSGYSFRKESSGGIAVSNSFDYSRNWTQSGDSTQMHEGEPHSTAMAMAGSSSGLGLSLPIHQRQPTPPAEPDHQAPPPPRPPYSPPPPPNMEEMMDRLLGETLQQFAQQEPSNRPPIPTIPPPTSPQTETAMPSPGTMSSASIHPDSLPESTTATLVEQQQHQQPELDDASVQVRKRYRVIEELTKTEHSFCVDMMVAHQIFEGTSKDVLTDQERRLLFSNCKELEAFSHDLWKRLKDAIRPVVNQTPPSENSSEPYDEFKCCTPENDRLVKIGEIMLQSTIKMERVYTTYYLNYGDASDFIKKNSENPELLGWVMACFQHCPNLTTAWDLDSLLVKPCQRMLKYPILLDDLISKTDPHHPDLKQLREANENIKAIALRIENAKSRQQTLRAATSEGKKQKKKGRFGNNIVKALISNKDRAKNLQEAALVFEDQDYNQITQKFGGHFFQIQIVIRDFDQYLDKVSEQMAHLNTMMLTFVSVSDIGPSANPEMESTWRRWAMAHIEIQNKALDAHKTNIRDRAMKPICEVWDQWVQPQKLMEQRKKLLLNYAKYKQAMDRKEKVDPKLEEAAKDFLTINDSLKLELPKLYELTKSVIRLTEIIFLGIQKDWYKTCSKKILPLLEREPQHTTSITYDLKQYTEHFTSDWKRMEERAKEFAIVNHSLLNNLPSFASPVATFYSDDGSSRKSSSRRTESIGSEYSTLEQQRNRNSGGYASTRSNVRSYDGHPPRSSPAHTGSSSALPSPTTPGPANPYSRAAERAISPSYSQASESTVTGRGRSSSTRQAPPIWGMDGAIDFDTYAQPPSAGPSFLNPTMPPPPQTSHANALVSSNPNSSRTSGVFSSALPMSDAPPAELPATPNDPDSEVEVLFLAASLFEFNIAHDRREGGIPYLVYVPGEIFDVIGMKGELWLARNQDDPTKTVGWIWEKHFARILPDES